MPSLMPRKHWEQFGSWLRKKRRDAEISQADVGRKAGISENQVARIEKGESGTKRETVIALAKAIGIDQSEALNMAGYAVPEIQWFDPNKGYGLIIPEYPKKPKNYIELLESLEALGIEIDWATIRNNMENFTEDDYQELLERIKMDTDFSVRRKVK